MSKEKSGVSRQLLTKEGAFTSDFEWPLRSPVSGFTFQVSLRRRARPNLVQKSAKRCKKVQKSAERKPET